MIPLIVIIIIHIAVFVSYPDTTPLGPTYLFISMIISSIFYYLLKPLLKKQTPSVQFYLNFALLIILILFTVINYPQSDSKSVIYKIYTANLPNRLTIYRGFKKLGIDANFILRDKK